MMELKPCPFCGGKARFVTRDDEDIWSHETVSWGYVLCESCDVQTSDWPIRHKDQGEAWNRRADQQVVNEALERAARVCEELPRKNQIQPADRRSRMATLCAAAIRALKEE